VFDLRYHVASLAAVFLALVVGILIGVGLTSQGVISTSERKILNQRISDLQRQRDSARQRSTDLAKAKRVADDFVKRTYPALMENRLSSTRVVVLFVGPVDGGIRSEIGETLADGGSTGASRVRGLRVPVNMSKVNQALRAAAFARFVGQPGHLGAALADEFVLGGKMPLWTALARQLVSGRDGSDEEPADGVVVVRSAEPQALATARLLSGLYDELVALGVPSVGVEDSDAPLSAVDAFRKHGVSSVDDLDTSAGRLALAIVLAGGQPGHYGLKASADDLLPPVEPVEQTTTTAAGG
jgi:Copper transport outer membrane protein, MctB